MKKIELTRGYVALVDDEDFDRVNAHKWLASKRLDTVYAMCTVEPNVLMHRFITGTSNPAIKVDHEDHNGLNNQKQNLRVCTHAQNCSSQKLSRYNTTGFKGVSFYKRDNNYSAYIKFDGRKRHLGYNPTAEEAALVYDAEAIKLF